MNSSSNSGLASSTVNAKKTKGDYRQQDRFEPAASTVNFKSERKPYAETVTVEDQAAERLHSGNAADLQSHPQEQNSYKNELKHMKSDPALRERDLNGMKS
jgi:hypothetical protein